MKKNLGPILALGGLVLVFGAGLFYLTTMGEEKVEAEPPLPPSVQMFTPVEEEKEADTTPEVVVGDIALSRLTVDFGSVKVGQKGQATFTVTAEITPAEISKVDILLGAENGLTLRSNCSEGTTLSPGQSCSVGVIWEPTKIGNIGDLETTVTARVTASDGETRAVTRTLALRGRAVEPPPPQAVKKRTVIPKETWQALQARRSKVLDQPVTAPEHVIASAADTEAKADDWSSIGTPMNESSFPVDMDNIITPDKPIPVATSVTIDNRQQSRVVAVVQRNIYGGHGRKVLIPRGSKAIGIASGAMDQIEGSGLVSVAWTTIIRPDGARFEFEGIGADQMGRVGAKGHYDGRDWERYSKMAMSSLMNATMTLLLDGGSTTTMSPEGGSTQEVDAKGAAAQQLRQDFQQITNDLMVRHQNVTPITTIPPGTQMVIYPKTDLVLKRIETKSWSERMAERMAAEEARKDNRASQQQQGGQQQDTGVPGAVGYDQYGRPVDANGNVVLPNGQRIVTANSNRNRSQGFDTNPNAQPPRSVNQPPQQQVRPDPQKQPDNPLFRNPNADGNRPVSASPWADL